MIRLSSRRSRHVLGLLALAGALASAPVAAQCELAKVYASDGGDTDQFGQAIAIASGTMLVGAHFNDEFGPNAGAAYVYRQLPDGTWTEVTKLTASDAAADDRYAFSVDIWQSRTAVIGSRYNDDIGYGSGSIYVYSINGVDWTEEAKLVANDEQVGSLFGASVAVHANTIVSGASDDDHSGISAGSAYVFSDLGAGWVQTQKLTASDASMDDRYGSSVDVFGDRIVVGAYGADDATVGLGTGAAYVYEKIGGTWTEVQKLTASQPTAGALFGQRVRIHQDTIVVGAVFGEGNEPFSGAAYVFERQPDGTWVETAKLTADDGAETDMFGASVAVHGDTILAGAWQVDGAAGRAYVFKKLPGGWTQIGDFQATDKQDFEHFGFALAYDGTHAAIGARQANDALGANVGAAYVYADVGAVYPYGKACAGQGGFVPSLAASGCPSPGGDFSLSVDGGLGGSTAILFFGTDQAAIPFGPPGCTFNVWPIFTTKFVLPLGGVGPGNGAGQLDLVIPPDAPSVVLTTQAWILDASVPFSGASGTNGLEITID